MMDKMLLGVAAIALLGCSSPQDISDSVAAENAGKSAAPSESAIETLERRTPGGAQATVFEDSQDTGDAWRRFAYQWPAKVSAIAPLEAYLTHERDKSLAEQKAEWEQAVAEFGTEGCVTCAARDYGKSWEVAADTPRFLSLIGGVSFYTGGAHPNSDFDSLIWDRETAGSGAALQPMALFTSQNAFEKAVRAPYCEGLKKERGERIGAELVAGASPFENCPTVDELTIVLRSSNGQTLDTVDMLAAPYVAGSYAEGPYEVTVPVTDVVMAVVKTEYRSDFSTQ